ncbi:IS3 family transposase [Kitasatospora sp. NPDC058201]|uniref:IS3 family transposase n=1 Tax=unclassified Kitasatospora TaxID=2633591 RepID=UPI003659F520
MKHRTKTTSYYRWRRDVHEPCARKRLDAKLTEHIRRIHADSDATYDSPRVHAVLRREGTHVGRKRVERLMRQAGLQGVSPRRPRSFTRRGPAADLAPDLSGATSPRAPRTGYGAPTSR